MIERSMDAGIVRPKHRRTKRRQIVLIRNCIPIKIRFQFSKLQSITNQKGMVWSAMNRKENLDISKRGERRRGDKKSFEQKGKGKRNKKVVMGS